MPFSIPPSPPAPSRPPLRICYVFQDEYPWDIRVDKFVNSLADAGHTVTIVSRNRTGKPRDEVLRSGVRVRRLPAGLTRLDRTLVNFPAFFSPVWLATLREVVRRERTDLIIVRDLPLGAAAARVGRAEGCPVVMDMAENYPAMIQATWDSVGPKPWDYLIRNPALLRRLERAVLPQMDGILVVSEASRARVRTLTNDRVPVWVVENTPRLQTGPAVRTPLVEQLSHHRGPVLLYVGNMDGKRGLDILVRALPTLKRRDPDVLVVIVGKGVMEPRLRQLAAELDVENNLLLPGWVEQASVPSLIAAADIGVIPHLVNEHTDTTIPNKIYDYMAQGKPVLVTQCTTLRHIVDTYQCGRWYTDRDPEDLARAALSLADERVRADLGDAGRRAVATRFRWERDAETLLEALARTAQARPLPSAVAG